MNIIDALKKSYPDITFTVDSSFYWSPKNNAVHYAKSYASNEKHLWALLHEVGHAVLKHQTYTTDFNLLQLEIEAWQKARQIARSHDIVIDPEHIQDCLDTYRDWLYQRSTCPSCTNCSLQMSKDLYSCFNCNESWRVSASRMCRSYRKRVIAPAVATT